MTRPTQSGRLLIGATSARRAPRRLFKTTHGRVASYVRKAAQAREQKAGLPPVQVRLHVMVVVTAVRHGSPELLRHEIVKSLKHLVGAGRFELPTPSPPV